MKRDLINELNISGYHPYDTLTWSQFCKLPENDQVRIRAALCKRHSCGFEHARIVMIPTPKIEAEIISEVACEIRKMLE